MYILVLQQWGDVLVYIYKTATEFVGRRAIFMFAKFQYKLRTPASLVSSCVEWMENRLFHEWLFLF